MLSNIFSAQTIPVLVIMAVSRRYCSSFQREDSSIPIKKGDSLIPAKGGKARVERARKNAGLSTQTARRIINQIIDADSFKKQLEKEIYDENKAITFLAVAAKFNPASGHEGAGGGGINIQINTMVDRDKVGDASPVSVNITPTEDEDEEV